MIPPICLVFFENGISNILLHKACLAATHGATVSTDGNAAKIPHHEGGEHSGVGGAISVCRQVRLESHRCEERTGNYDTPLSAIARLQRDCQNTQEAGAFQTPSQNVAWHPGSSVEQDATLILDTTAVIVPVFA